MSGTALRIDLRALDAINRRIDDIANVDRGALLDVIGAEVVSQTQRRISADKKAPDGTPWPAWSADYASTRHGGHSLLQGDALGGGLLGSIQHVVNGEDDVEVGSNLVYAPPHQYGWPEGKIPQREYIGLSPENEQDVIAVVNVFVDQHLQGANP